MRSGVGVAPSRCAAFVGATIYKNLVSTPIVGTILLVVGVFRLVSSLRRFVLTTESMSP